jgi:hypothetical protein
LNLLKNKTTRNYGKTCSSIRATSPVSIYFYNRQIISYAFKSKEFILGLLNNLGAYIDPLRVVSRIPSGLEIPGLKPALLAVLRDLSTEISLREGCKDILFGDTVDLEDRLVSALNKGMGMPGKSSHVC